MDQKQTAKFFSVAVLVATAVLIVVIGTNIFAPAPAYLPARMFGNWTGAMLLAYLVVKLFTRSPECWHLRLSWSGSCGL